MANDQDDPGSPTRTRHGRARLAVAAMVAGWLISFTLVASWLGAAQSQSRQQITARLQARAALGAEFSSLYVSDIFARERAAARTWLAGPRVSAALFTRVSASMGLSASVLLDARGRLLAVAPSKPSLIGADLAVKYAHLAGAEAGRPTASQVVHSAARGLPVVGFAIPFPSTAGLRVFSGAWDVADTPLGVYVAHLLTLAHHRIFLIDGHGNVIAGSDNLVRPVSLAEFDPGLARAVTVRGGGEFNTAHGAISYVSTRVPGLPWRLVASVPAGVLYAAVDGADAWFSWVALAGFGLAGLLAIALVIGLRDRGAKLSQLNTTLEQIAHTDPLTGLPNRRATDIALVQAISGARRHGHELSILLVDLDHFKQVNDTYGHHAGDQVLAGAASAIAGTLRVEDVAGRWGGEEFLVLLPDTDLDGAAATAERLRIAVAERTPSAGGPPVTATVGVVEWSGDDQEALLQRADAALYRGKAAGRNIVELEPAHLVG